MANELQKTSNENLLLLAINTANSLDDLKVIIAKLTGLKEALKEADEFRENSIKFAELEAMALIKIVELGGAKMIKGRYRQATAEWLATLSETERSKYIQMCGEGLTIDQVWRREIRSEEKLSQGIKRLETYCEIIVDEAKEEGIVDLTEFDDDAKATFKGFEGMATDFSQRVRRNLLNAGAVGIGGGEKIYVMPNSKHTNEIKKAIVQRFEDICEEISKIRVLAETSNVTFKYQELIPHLWQTKNTNEWQVFLVAILATVKAISNFDEFMDTVVNIDSATEWHDFVSRYAKSKKDYHQIELNKIQKMEGTV